MENKIFYQGDTGDLWRCLREEMNLGKDMVLATVIARDGSGPREPGASLLVGAAGYITGTVGGGVLEERVIALARTALQTRQSSCREFVLTANEAAEEGMICGGRVEILFDFWAGDDDIRRDIMNRAGQICEARRSCQLIRSLSNLEVAAEDKLENRQLREGQGERSPAGAVKGKNDLKVATGLGLWDGEDFLSGTLACPGPDREILMRTHLRREAVLISAGNSRCFIQPLGRAETVVIVGAGHIAQALAPLCCFTGFQTVIVDDRADFACRELFPTAAALIVSESFEKCFQDLNIGSASYIVIVTRGHIHDQTVLVQALHTEAAYLGMIGSRKKRETIYRSLGDEGFTREDLARVHCPIGMTIGAQTPEEIAVSIVAELIAVRSGQLSGYDQVPDQPVAEGR